MNKILILIAVIVLLIIFWPFVLIWALNTLFPALNIAYDIWTWLAAIILSGPFTARYFGGSRE